MGPYDVLMPPYESLGILMRPHDVLMPPYESLMSPDEVLATSVCKFAESFTRFTIDESAFSFNLSIAITSSSGLLLALLIKTLEIFHVQTRAFHTVRFTPCVSHRAFHKPVPRS